MPAEVGDIGFPMVVHPRDDRTLWVFPMDGSDVWPRVSPGGRPAAYVSRDGGEAGSARMPACPSSRRGGRSSDRRWPPTPAARSAYIGTTSGELWHSRDEGSHWHCLARHLPEIYAVETCLPSLTQGCRCAY